MQSSSWLRIYYVAAFAVVGVSVPFFPRWLEARGMHGVELGLIVAASPAMGLLAPFAFGAASDALGLRGGLLRIACLGALISWGSLTTAAAAGSSLGFPTLLLAALAFAWFRSPMILVADVTALEGAHLAGTSYGKLRLWGSLGFLGAVVLAARFVDPNERMALPLATSVALLAALLASLGIPDRAKLPRLGNRHGAVKVLASPNFKLLLFSAFLGQCAHAGYDLCFTLHLFDLGMSRNAIGLAWAIGTAFEVALMASASRAFRGLAPAPLLAFALGSAALRWTILASVRSPAIILLLQPLHALSFGLMWLAAVGYAQERAPAHSLGTAQGLLSTAFGAGSVTGMLLWGPAYQRGGGTVVFASAAFVAAFASACAAALAGLDRKLRARSEAE
jgi:PPP family 3-phenylpropionic acid transporter